MDIKKLEGRKAPVKYKSRKNEGVATVRRTYAGETGAWVELFDRRRGVTVIVRPSQCEPAR